MSTVHVIVPEGIDDARRPTGGNVYDRRVCQELSGRGWRVHEHPAPGPWPRPEPADLAALDRLLSRLPDRSVVLLDGLVAAAAPEVLLRQAPRLRVVVLVHMPAGDDQLGGDVAQQHARERTVLGVVDAVVTSSEWARDRLVVRHGLETGRVHVAEPGTDPADHAPGTASGGELLCVAAVAPHKGHDVLLDALARLRGLSWRCTCAGTLERDPGFVARLRKQARADGIDERVRFVGPLTGTDLDTAYRDSDLLVLASRGETYGMVAAEALARGIPVVATAVGGLPRTLGHSARGEAPGLLVPADDPDALAAALASWLGDQRVRRRLREAAVERRTALPRWSATAERIAAVLEDDR
jgi:glycosyltransferase involved in cell wall biosynthesis